MARGRTIRFFSLATRAGTMQASSMRTALAIALALPLAGCLAGKLRTPVEDHYVQTRVIADTCKAGGYDGECPVDLQEDLDHMKAQACALDAITKSEAPDACETPSQESDK